MPTPSKAARDPQGETPKAEWAARSVKPPRSVFGNYRAKQPAAPAVEAQNPPGGGERIVQAPPSAAAFPAESPDSGRSLQASIDLALARSFLYRILAWAYEDPTEESWRQMTGPDCRHTLRAAVAVLAAEAPAVAETVAALEAQLDPAGFEAFLAAYLAAFGHAARGRCPLNEIEYGDIKADPLFQPHRLADLAAFYRAFGLEVAPRADERHDHLCLELEFMCVLAAKEAYALDRQLDAAELARGRDAQKQFLREHLGRWTPAFARRLAAMAGGTPLGALGNLTRAFVETECARYGVAPGSDDLLLRPVDEAAESLCASCNLPPPPTGGPGQI